MVAPMSGHVHYLEDLPIADYLLDDLERPNGERFMICTSAVFWSIADYSRSQPTGPSPGRIYRKDLLWNHVTRLNIFGAQGFGLTLAANWFVYVCERCTDDHRGHTDKCVAHHPYKPIFVDWDLGLLPSTLVVDKTYRIGAPA